MKPGYIYKTSASHREAAKARQKSIYVKRGYPSTRKSNGITSTEDRRILRELVRSYKTQHPCVDCGESDFRVLQFDHRDPLKKLFAIGQGDRWPLAALVAEIAKCDIRCANCHSRRTFEEKHWLVRRNNISSGPDLKT
jgi:hypothetical protein